MELTIKKKGEETPLPVALKEKSNISRSVVLFVIISKLGVLKNTSPVFLPNRNRKQRAEIGIESNDSGI